MKLFCYNFHRQAEIIYIYVWLLFALFLPILQYGNKGPMIKF